MSTSKKRLARSGLIAAAVTTALVMTGCSAAEPAPSATPTKGGTLSVWFPGTNQAEIDLVTKKIVPAFEKKTGSTVTVTYVDWNNISPKLNAAFAAGTAPDVFGHGPAAAADFVANGRLEPLTSDVASMSASDRKDTATAFAGGKVDGTQYLIPLSMTGNLLMYNADDFTAAGLDPDKPPTTWEAVLADAKKLTKRENGSITRSGLLLPSQPIGRQQSFATLLFAAGGKLVNSAGTAAAFNSSAGVQALNYMKSLYTGPDAVSANLGADYANAPIAQQPLVLGTASMTMLPSTTMQQIIAANPDKDLRVVQPTSLGSGKPAAFGGAGPGLMVNADSKQKALAWQFIDYMISPSVSAEYTQGIGAIPIRASALSTDYVKNSAVLKAFLKASPDFMTNPNVGGWVQVRDQLDKQVEQALQGATPAKDALTAAANASNPILKANG
ncbi:ABC transporter substrate-binding protein [Leifsonia shinshuensis]